MKVRSAGPIGGMLRFDLPGIGEAAVGPAHPSAMSSFRYAARRKASTQGSRSTSLESSPELVRCELLRKGVLVDLVSLSLAGNGQTFWLIDQNFPDVDTSDFVGSVRCSAVGEGLFSAVALEMDPGTRIFTTLPVVPVPERMSQE